MHQVLYHLDSYLMYPKFSNCLIRYSIVKVVQLSSKTNQGQGEVSVHSFPLVSLKKQGKIYLEYILFFLIGNQHCREITMYNWHIEM